MLCLMAGPSYLDLLLIFGTYTSSIYNVFHKATAWIVATFEIFRVSTIQPNITLLSDGFASARNFGMARMLSLGKDSCLLGSWGLPTMWRASGIAAAILSAFLSMNAPKRWQIMLMATLRSHCGTYAAAAARRAAFRLS
jgi:hypothetical protein